MLVTVEATLSGLNPNTQYSVSVAGVNSAGNSIDTETPSEYMDYSLET